MDVLPLNFRVLRYCGVWFESPEHWWLVKTIYKISVVTLIFIFTLAELIELCLSYDKVEDLMECLFLTLTFFALCLKMINFMCRQESLTVLMNIFRMDICQAKTSEEKVILQQCRDKVKASFVFYMGFGLLSGSLLVFVPFASIKTKGIELPVKTYRPYDDKDPKLFTITYVQQVLCMYYGLIINVTLDVMACGFILLACGQFDLCCHRIITRKSSVSIDENVKHHAVITDIVQRVESFFILVTVPLFCFSLVVLCTSLFQMPKKKVLSFEFITLFIYFTCILFQIFIYCWVGNELQLKSKSIANAIFQSDWITYSPRQRRKLIFSMFMSQKGFMISFHGQCSLSIDTYVSILKTSYGVFNLLRKVAEI